MSTASDRETDVVLIGAGIMSATLGVFLKELEPSLSIQTFEILGDCARESSDSWNNAGTGHAANCEMNYTPQRPDGSVDISKALQVNVEFDLSRQFWSYLIGAGSDRGSQVLHSSGATHEFCARGGERRVSPKAVQGDVGPSLL
ncbi:L-2-hydroxyglutarate oxidase LhgO [Bradyrhizobium sp. LM3.4]